MAERHDHNVLSNQKCMDAINHSHRDTQKRMEVLAQTMNDQQKRMNFAMQIMFFVGVLILVCSVVLLVKSLL